MATDPDTSYPPIVPRVQRQGVHWVQLDIDAAAADQDHLIAPEERFRLAMAKQ